MNILNSLGAGIIAIALSIGSFFGYTPVEDNSPLGASLPSGTAVFETSLATGITDLSTSMVLTSTSIRGGATLSGYQCFTIDEGSAQAEYVCGTVATNTVSSLERGISPADGVTSVTALTFSHRRGANVKITDFPLIQRIQAQNSGNGTFDAVIKYGAGIGTSTVGADGQNIASVAYANSLAFGAVPAANETTAGFTELATAQEAASSTQTGGTGARLSLSTALSTSTAPASGHVVVMTGIDGNIASGFLPDAIGSSTMRVYTTVGTTTWTKPTGLKYIIVEGIGGGGGGGNDSGTGSSNLGGGGGGGAYFKKLIPAALLSSTEIVTVANAGAGGATNVAGTNGSSTIFGAHATATGGTGGTLNHGGGGGGGTATGGDLNITGQTGSGGYYDGNQGASSCGSGGLGGNSFMGFGALESASASGYGGGGKGSCDGAGTTSGTQGVVIITEYY